jgi:hypothetical protein
MKDRLPKPIKPGIDTPNTVILGVYSDGATAGVAGSFRTMGGILRTEVLTAAGPLWTALHTALDAAAALEAGNLVIFSNDGALVAALSPPFPAPAATATAKLWYSATKVEKALPVNAGYGGNADHWASLAELGGRYGGRFNVIKVDDLRRAKEIWQLHTK